MLVVGAVFVWLFGLLMRVHLLRTPGGALNADEAYTGLQALAILRGDLPTVIGGAGYTAVLDSYFFMPFVWIFGAHVVPLKLLSSLWWSGAALLMYWLAKRFVGRSWGLLAASMVWVAPGALMLLSTRAYEAYGLGLLVSVLTAFATTRIVTDRELKRRWVMLAGAGAGLAFYLHPMFVAVAFPMMLVPCWVHRRVIRGWWVPAVGSAVFVNIPLLFWNVRNSWPSLSQPVPATESAVTRFGRFFSGLLPRAFGLRNPGGEWLWGGLSVVIYIVLLALVLCGVVRLARLGSQGLVLALPTVLCWPILTLFNNMGFVDDGRYAIVGYPFLIVALVVGLRSLFVPTKWSQFAGYVAPPLVGVMWAGIFLIPWINDYAPDVVDDPNANVQAIVDVLVAEEYSYAVGNYWLALPIEYQSDRKVVTAVAGYPLVVRLAQTQSEVMAAAPSEVAHVFLLGDEQVDILRLPIEEYERREVGGAVLYLPLVHSVVPQ
jgi:4-amino-4-deoxy-L-arabinose transferase-like glycosyltransferase